MLSNRIKVWVGSLLLVGSVLTLLLALTSPGFADPAGRIGRTAWSGLEPARPDDLLVEVETLEGVHVGSPVFRLETGHETTPVAHVVSLSTAADGTHHLRVRFAIDHVLPGEWQIRVFPPRKGLQDAYRLAVPPSAARAVGAVMVRRLRALWATVLEPTLKEQLPAFLARIDPRQATASKVLLNGFGDDALRRLRPLMNDLLDTITHSLEKRFDLWDRMGVLWKFVRGDGKGLKRKVQPVAEKAAQTWWAAHQDEVLAALGETFRSQMPALRRWLETEVLAAAREELLEPVLARHRAEIEREGKTLMRLAMREIIESDEGGFRVRFAAMLRMTLLGKRRALLLLEWPGARDE